MNEVFTHGGQRSPCVEEEHSGDASTGQLEHTEQHPQPPISVSGITFPRTEDSNSH